MTDFFIGDTKLASPTSDPEVDYIRTIQRMASEIRNLQTAVARGVPPGFQLVVDGEDVWLVQRTQGRRAKIQLTWESTP
jgi:hypothetical protein